VNWRENPSSPGVGLVPRNELTRLLTQLLTGRQRSVNPAGLLFAVKGQPEALFRPGFGTGRGAQPAYAASQQIPLPAKWDASQRKQDGRHADWRGCAQAGLAES